MPSLPLGANFTSRGQTMFLKTVQQLENNLKSSACPVAAWRSGHRIRLKN
jgi:hypothetical protein